MDFKVVINRKVMDVSKYNEFTILNDIWLVIIINRKIMLI